MDIIYCTMYGVNPKPTHAFDYQKTNTLQETQISILIFFMQETNTEKVILKE